MGYKEIAKGVKFVSGYDELLEVLMEAYNRAAHGKGHKRHAKGEPFINQWILRGARAFGLGGLNFQIGKKNEEITQLEDTEAKIRELLDIIVYAAAGVILLKENENSKE